MQTLQKRIVTSPLAAAAVILAVWILNTKMPSIFFPHYSMGLWLFVSAFLINAVVFLFGYPLLESPRTPGLWKGLLYLVTVTGANWCLTMLRSWRWSMDWTYLHHNLFFALPFLVSLPLNFFFLKYLFKKDDQRAISMGILLGVIESQSVIVSIPLFH